jgi:hypothetical protein
MSRTLRLLAQTFASTVCLLTVVAGVASPAAATSVGPGQYFRGYVNGTATNAIIQMGCFGPAGGTGHPLSGQYVLASQVPNSTTTNVGYTGTSANAIAVALVLHSSSGTTTYPIGTITVYDAKLAIPTTLTLPCSGSGNVVFTPTPTSSSAKAATVAVTLSGQP